MRALSALTLAALAGCGWDHLPQQASTGSEPLWDASDVVPTVDGLYVRLPRAGALALVKESGASRRIPLGEGRVTRIDAAPNGHTVVAFVERYRCLSDDARVELPSDCAKRDLDVTTEITLVDRGEVTMAQPLSGAYNELTFSDDGRIAVGYLDLSQPLEVDSVLNLTGVVVIDLERGTSQLVPVGFAADHVLFVQDEETGATVEAVVVSRNAVAVLDVQDEVPREVVTFPLSLDPDTVVDPVGIDLTPDAHYALLSARGTSDLYALDLELHAINIVDLAGQPGAMAVDGPANRTAFVYPNLPLVQLLDHRFFDTQTIALDEPMDRIALGDQQAVLWSASGAHDLYRIDTRSTDLVEYRLQNPATDLFLAPTKEFALVLTRPEGGSGSGVDGLYDVHPGMEVVDLRSERSEPFLLEGQGLGVAFAQDPAGTTLNALVLQQDVDYLFRLDLYTRQTEEIPLDAPAVRIGSMPDGTFFITHDRALGLVSFLDPDTGEVTTAAGFAAAGSLDLIELAASGEEE
ncbi:MAG: hypothetical protein R3F59_27210 [Myxococcota bacterium]